MAAASFNNNKEPMADINVTPLVDVMLVLLIIFMVTAPMMTQGVDVNLPQTTAGPLEAKKPPVIVSITPGGEIYINEQRGELATLGAAIAQEEKLHGPGPVYLKADRTVPYGLVVQVMGRLKAAGVEKLGMVTESPVEKSE
ncbi:MAG: protein TolR [Deltaproteobacteria bacterium]|nr:protein TolR [Deltaproteobacteria bacterium]MBW1952288.1 protein TolR [Deltaproteobacteria bacterium]MBW1986016.1 protein TolR [Deltaproteobacteria bacterium]MBW2134822.1 protein TolR [Deltaproteobacteria bacterium]